MHTNWIVEQVTARVPVLSISNFPLNRPPGTFSPTGGEGRDEGVRIGTMNGGARLRRAL